MSLRVYESAARLDLPMGTVKSRLHEARRRLAQDPRITAFAPEELAQ